jgi:hypothetical protein
MVDGNKVLSTRNGNVVRREQPQQSDAFADTKWVAAPPANAEAAPVPPKPSAKPENTANFEKSVDKWVATDRSKTASTQFEKTHAEPIPHKEQESQGRLDLNSDNTSQEASQPIDVPATSADSEPLPVLKKEAKQPTEDNADLNRRQMEEKGYVDSHSEPIEQTKSVEQKQSSSPAEPKVNEAGPIPPDYGLGKNISDDAIVASGDRALMGAHGSLEAKRLELNDCVKRGKEPGFSHLNERATVKWTRTTGQLERDHKL